MYLENIRLLNFKNYSELELDFSEQINCITGDNGAGKTNLLDAIHYLSLTKSAFNTIDSQNIKKGQDFFMIKGAFNMADKKETVQCQFKNGQRKVFKYNNSPYDKLSDHVGKFPVVIIAPGDQEIIQEGSEFRRKFFDSLLSQLSPVYLSSLVRYHQALRHRNALLKQFYERNFVDEDLVEPFTSELLLSGREIYKFRADLMLRYVPILKELYARIADSREAVDMIYLSDLAGKDFDAQFRGGLKRDIMMQRTATGIHKDDFELLIEGNPLKRYGSQGQQKSFVVAMKLAQFELIKRDRGFNPLLLMDDIFDKLDDKRIGRLMEMVAGHSFGQLFVTDARPERSVEVFRKIGSEAHMIAIDNGRAFLKN